MDALVKNATKQTPIGVDQHLVIDPGQTVNVPNWEVLRGKPATAARLECGDLVEVDAPAVDTEEAERQRLEAEAEAERQRLEDEERQRAEAEEAERQRVAAAEAAAAANKQKPHVPTPRR